METNTIDVSNLCSRKLWELLKHNHSTSEQTQRFILESELLKRSHYVSEIQQLRQHQQH